MYESQGATGDSGAAILSKGPLFWIRGGAFPRGFSRVTTKTSEVEATHNFVLLHLLYFWFSICFLCLFPVSSFREGMLFQEVYGG